MAGIHSHPGPFSYDGLIAEKNPFYEGEILFQNGLFFLQDEASQIVTFLLQPQPGELILDACAAPGGKGTDLAQVMGNQGKIIAIDLQEEKIRMIEENARRLGVKIIEVSPADAGALCPSVGDRFSTAFWSMPPAPDSEPCIAIPRPNGGGSRKTSIASSAFSLPCFKTSLPTNRGILVYSTCTLTPQRKTTRWWMAS